MSDGAISAIIYLDPWSLEILLNSPNIPQLIMKIKVRQGCATFLLSS